MSKKTMAAFKEIQNGESQQTQTKRKQRYRVVGTMSGEIVETFESEVEAAEFCKAWSDDFCYDFWTVEMV